MISPRCSNEVKFLLFADDTNIYLESNNLNHIQTVANRALASVSEWLKSNRLTLNLTKTQIMLSRPLMTPTTLINIYIDGIKLNQINSAKFLGEIIDDQLKWKPQIDDINEKLSKLTGIIYRIRNNLSKEHLRLIYFALVYPHLLYCSAIWGGGYGTDLNSLFTTQKKILRTMHYKGRYDHSNLLFADSKLLKLNEILDLQVALFVYKSLHLYLVNPGFVPLPPSRRVNELRIPLCLTTHAQHSILIRGSRQWNQLPQDLRSAQSHHIFKNRYKKILLNKYMELSTD